MSKRQKDLIKIQAQNIALNKLCESEVYKSATHDQKTYMVNEILTTFERMTIEELGLI